VALAALLLPAGTAAFGFDDVARRAKPFGLERIPAVTGKLWWLAPVVGALIAAAPSRARAGVVDRDLPLAGVPRAAVAAPDAAGG